MTPAPSTTNNTSLSSSTPSDTAMQLHDYIVKRDDLLNDSFYNKDLYVFGYGSLCWRPAFEFASQEPCWLQGWKRVWYQRSVDHRGTPDLPGRVVTIIPDKTSDVLGMVFRIEAERVKETLDYLDVREKGGYVLAKVPVFFHQQNHQHNVEHDHTQYKHHNKPHFDIENERYVNALVYIAVEGNEDWLGPASSEKIAMQIFKSVGPSGRNIEYLTRLAEYIIQVAGIQALIQEQTWELYHLVKQYIEEHEREHFERHDCKQHCDVSITEQLHHIYQHHKPRRLSEIFHANTQSHKSREPSPSSSYSDDDQSSSLSASLSAPASLYQRQHSGDRDNTVELMLSQQATPRRSQTVTA